MKFKSLKILADENVSPKTVEYIRSFGIDIISVIEEGWSGEEDEVLLKKTVICKRFILTLDSDFGTLAINEGVDFFGIIFLRTKNPTSKTVNEIIKKSMDVPVDFTGRMIVVLTDKKIRIRKIE